MTGVDDVGFEVLNITAITVEDAPATIYDVHILCDDDERILCDVDYIKPNTTHTRNQPEKQKGPATVNMGS